MGSKRLDQISDYARHGYDLRIECRACGHVGILDSVKLKRRCRSHVARMIPAIVSRLICRECEQRDFKVGMIDRAASKVTDVR